MIAYEQISNFEPSGVVDTANEILSEGWRRREYEAVNVRKPIPWEWVDASLRSWNFHIHCLDMVDPLLAAHSSSGEERFLKPSLDIAVDWVQKHSRSAIDVSPMAWYDMAVGLRAYRLGYIYDASEKAGLLSKETKNDLWASIIEHRDELSDDRKIAFHNNHGYFQVAGQLALGRRFRDVSPAMHLFYTQGAERLERMLDQQFTKEGVHREHSPDYHRMVATTLLGLVRAGLVERSDLLHRTAAIQNSLAWFVTPDGTIANFGDSDSRKMTRSGEIASSQWDTPLMQAVASDREVGGGWPNGLQAFHEAGYAIVREPHSGVEADGRKDSYLAQIAAFHSRTHKHCDDLSFIWHDKGQSLLVDAGRYGYIGKTDQGSALWHEGFWYEDPMRIFVESTRAHNTLEFDGLNSLRKGVTPYGSGLVQTFSCSGVYCIETKCKQHKSIWHRRLLLFSPGEWVIVFDVFNDELGAPHDVKQWFHFAPGHVSSRTNGGFNISLLGGGELKARTLLKDPMPGSIITGRSEAPLQGWWSSSERNAKPADALHFSLSKHSDGVFATLLSISDGSEPKIVHQNNNLSKKRANLCWEDQFGTKCISLNWDAEFKVKFIDSFSEGRTGRKILERVKSIFKV